MAAIITGTGSNGTTYTIGSETGRNFVNGAAAGTTMRGGDDSTWTKNSDGSTTITKDGTVWTVNSGPLTIRAGNSVASVSGADADAVRSISAANNVDYGVAYDIRLNQLGIPVSQGYTHSPSGGSGGSATPYNAQNDAYAQMLAAQEAANAAAVQKAVNSLERQKSDTEKQYAELYRQLYVDKMRSRKNLSQQLAASGVTGGAAETTMLGCDTAYEDALRQGEQGRISALGSLDQAIADARLSGDIANAEAAASTAKEQLSAYMDALKYLTNRQDSLDARQESYAREDAAAARGYAYKTAMQLIEAATMPSEELLTAAGIDRATAEGLVAAVAAERGYNSLSAAGKSLYRQIIQNENMDEDTKRALLQRNRWNIPEAEYSFLAALL